MSVFNHVQLIGYFGKDLEGRFTQTGKKVTDFSFAVTQHWITGGKIRENTSWIYVEASGRLGDLCEQYMHEGNMVYVEGRLQQDPNKKKGQANQPTKVIALQVQTLDEDRAGEPPNDVEEDINESETA